MPVPRLHLKESLVRENWVAMRTEIRLAGQLGILRPIPKRQHPEKPAKLKLEGGYLVLTVWAREHQGSSHYGICATGHIPYLNSVNATWLKTTKRRGHWHKTSRPWAELVSVL